MSSWWGGWGGGWGGGFGPNILSLLVLIEIRIRLKLGCDNTVTPEDVVPIKATQHFTPNYKVKTSDQSVRDTYRFGNKEPSKRDS